MAVVGSDLDKWMTYLMAGLRRVATPPEARSVVFEIEFTFEGFVDRLDDLPQWSAGSCSMPRRT
ncbi:hypothetical protein [Streptomyces sp. 150FB]|uniref:hypothetical protein n=1 Tax=Streptomyces sp. 150FB TaxID=1576605 RepID=UPI00058966F3|nr:hypothetical protein [Streptomyces sp. 150FB]